MSKNQNIGLTLVSPESLILESEDWLEIVQPEWPEPPDGGFLGWLLQTGKGLTLATVQEYFGQYKSHCADDGSCEIEIQVHRSRPDLDYAITASYGDLSEKFLHTGEHIYSMDVDQTDSIDLEREIVGGVSASWEGEVIAEDLSFINPKPAISQDGSVLSWGVVCTGTLRLKYAEEHDTYILTIVPRTGADVDPNDLETAYQSTVTALYAGGRPVRHEVDLPDMTGYCNGGSSAIIDPDDPDEGGCYDLYIKRHKCTGEEISRKLVSVPCPPDEEEES